MPIIPDKNILFIHIPKTGGTFVEWEMQMEYDEKHLFSTTTQGIYSNNIHFHLQHMNYSTIIKENFFADDYLKHFYKFTFVRNPYTRVLSEYFWRLNLDVFDPERFHKFVVDRYVHPKDAHFLPQIFYFDIKYDFVGKYENLINDLKMLYLNLNINRSVTDIKRNGSNYNKMELLNKLDKSTVELINNLFEKDFVLGDYERI